MEKIRDLLDGECGTPHCTALCFSILMLVLKLNFIEYPAIHTNYS